MYCTETDSDFRPVNTHRLNSNLKTVNYLANHNPTIYWDVRRLILHKRSKDHNLIDQLITSSKSTYRLPANNIFLFTYLNWYLYECFHDLQVGCNMWTVNVWAVNFVPMDLSRRPWITNLHIFYKVFGQNPPPPPKKKKRWKNFCWNFNSSTH